MGKWLLRLLMWAVGLVCAMLACAFFLMQLESVQQVVAQRILNIVNRQIAGTLSVQHIGLKLHGAVTVRNLALQDDLGHSLLSVERAQVWLAPWDLVLGRVHVLKADVIGLRGIFEMDSSGSNIQKAVATPPDAEQDTTNRQLWMRFDRLNIAVDSLAVQFNTSFAHTFQNHSVRGEIALTDSIITYTFDIELQNQFTLQSSAVVRPYSDTLIAGDVIFRGSSRYVIDTWSPAFPDFGALEANLHAHVLRRDLTALYEVSAVQLGQLKGDIEIESYSSEPRVSLGMAFTNIDLSTWIGDSIAHVVHGRAALTKSASPEWAYDWRGRIEIDSSFYGDVNIDADLEAELFANTAAVAGEVRTNSGEFDLRITSDGLSINSMYLYGRAKLQDVDLHAFVPTVPDSLSPLSGQTEFEFYQIAGEELIIDAMLALGPLSLGRYQLDSLAFHVRVDSTHFRLDSTRIRLGTASALLFARGDYTENIDVEFTASILEIADFRDLLRPYFPEIDTIAGDAQLDFVTSIVVADSTTDVGTRGKLTSDAIAYRDYVAYGVKIEVDTLISSAEELSAKLTCDSVSAFDEMFAPIVLSLSGPWFTPEFSLALAARQDTFKMVASGSADFSSAPLTVSIPDLVLELIGTKWHNDFPIDLSLDSTHYEVGALIMRSDFGVLRATGYLEKPGIQDLALEFSGLRTGKLGPLLRTVLPDGDLNLRVQIAGPDSAVAGRLDMLIDSVTYAGARLADRISFSANLTDDGLLTANAVYLWFADTAMVASAVLPARVSMQEGLIVPEGEQLAGTLRVDSLELERFRPWLTSGTILDGFLSADLQLAGSVLEPDWRGDVQLQDGFYRDTRLGIAYKWIVLDADLRRDSLLIHTFRATSRGTMTGSGFARLGVPWPKELDLQLKFDKFEAVNSRIQQARLDGDLHVTGPVDSLDAKGRLSAQEGYYRLTQSATKTIEPVNLDSVLAHLRGDSLEEGFNADAYYASMSHDLTIVIPGNFWIRGAGLNTELSGQLRVQKEHRQSPTANGEIAIRKGTVKFYGQELRIAENSNLRFDGPADSPELNISAVYSGVERERGYEVTVTLTGTPDRSMAEFSGQYNDGTAMSSDEAIQKLLPFAGGGEGGFSAEQSVIDAASGQVSDIVGKASGLDVFEFRPGPGGLNDLSSGQLELGTYVTDRLFIRVFQPIEDPRAGQKVSIDYRLLDWMKLTAEQESRERSSSSSSFTVYLQFEWH